MSLVTVESVRKSLYDMVSGIIEEGNATFTKNNEVVFPFTGEDESGAPVTMYGFLSWGVKSNKDTKRAKAFNLDEAVAVYQAKKAKPIRATADRVSCLDTELGHTVIEFLTGHDSFTTAQELTAELNANLPGAMEPLTWQKVSAILKVAEKAGTVERGDVVADGKTKAGYKVK